MRTSRLKELEPVGDIEEDFPPTRILSQVLKQKARDLSQRTARYLISAYYVAQDDRKRVNSQIKEAQRRGEDTAWLEWFMHRHWADECAAKSALDEYTSQHPVGVWSRSIVGVGPVIAAGMLAYVDMDKAVYPSKIQRFSGIDPSLTWNKGELRPYCDDLHQFLWYFSEAQVKKQSSPDSFYGAHYRKFRDIEDHRDLTGQYAHIAARLLEEKHWSDDKEAKRTLQSGHLTKLHLYRRACRKLQAMWVNHWWYVAFCYHYHRQPPKVYSQIYLDKEGIEHLDYVEPPNLYMVDRPWLQ